MRINAPTPAVGLERERLIVPLLLAGASGFGALVAARPELAIGAIAIAAVVALAFMAPVVHLSLLLFVTAVIPYDVQNAYGGGSAGLIFSDLLLLTGLLRATLMLLRMPLRGRQVLSGAALVAFVAVTLLQAWRGYQLGVPLSLAGYEFRALFGWSTLLIAMPILLHPVGRRRLLSGLLVVGLGLGLWGVLQYFARIPLVGGGSAGIRQNVNFTQGAVSVQGGLFGFPIAFVMGLAALSSGAPHTSRTRVALIAIVALNGVSLLLTYERTFWVAAVVGLAFITLKARWSQRVKAVMLLMAILLAALPILTVLAPGSLAAVQQRFLSLGQYGSDDSVRARVVENRAVVRKVREKPVFGSGLGDQVSYGYPWLRVPPQAVPYTHNGYLWIAWRLGLPVALLLLGLVTWALVARAPPGLDALTTRVREGAQAGLLISLVVSLTFPAFRALAITTTLGVLVALSLMGSAQSAPTRHSRGR